MNSTPCRPKGSPSVLFWDIYFWLTDLKIVFKAPWAPIYPNFEGGARAEKTRFLVKIFQKVPKNGMFGLLIFLKNLPAGQKISSNYSLYSGLGELKKSIWLT